MEPAPKKRIHFLRLINAGTSMVSPSVVSILDSLDRRTTKRKEFSRKDGSSGTVDVVVKSFSVHVDKQSIDRLIAVDDGFFA